MNRSSTLAITRLTANIGAEIHGIDLRRGIEVAHLALLRTAVAEHHVVVLRDQHLTAEQHAVVASAFGPILASPVQRAIGHSGPPGVTTIEDTADRPPAGFPWHTDVSWSQDPPALGFLSAVTIPTYGGDTIWASTAALYDDLPPDLQARCHRLRVLHSPDQSLLASVERHHGSAVADRLRAEHPGVQQPLVREHPVTGRTSLFLSPLYAREVVGAGRTDPSDGALLDLLHARLDDPHLQLRWRWAEGDFVIWDETSTCHRALTDHHPQRRVMRRCVTGPAT